MVHELQTCLDRLRVLVERAEAGEGERLRAEVRELKARIARLAETEQANIARRVRRGPPQTYRGVIIKCPPAAAAGSHF